MEDYFKKTEFILDLLYFHHHGNRYQGRGIMTWNPDEGFHLEAFLDGKGKPIEKIDLGRIQITPKSDICSIRMRPQGYDWAFVHICLSEQNKLNILNNRLSINFGRAVFCESVDRGSKDFWTGTALYETKSKLLFSDRVHTEIRINDQEMGWKSEVSGIFYEDDQQRKLIGHLVDDKQLKIYWELPKQSWSKAAAWKWTMAIQDVLSIWFGETIWLLQREFIRDVQKITEIRQKAKLSALGSLSPFGGLQFEKQTFVKLTDFFIHEPSKAEVCRRIFLQLVEASNQHSQQAQELLLSTILEASLRSIYGCAFTAKKDKWNVGKGLENFFKDYLPSEEWTNDVRNRVMIKHCHLRNRNAHPDWLVSEGVSSSEVERAQSLDLDSMILLSRFYGYMILALAEFKVQPIFPPSHQTWGAAATITVASNSNSENAFSDLYELAERSGHKKLHEKLSEAKTYHGKTMIWRYFYRTNDQ